MKDCKSLSRVFFFILQWWEGQNRRDPDYIHITKCNSYKEPVFCYLSSVKIRPLLYTVRYNLYSLVQLQRIPFNTVTSLTIQLIRHIGIDLQWTFWV